MKLKTEYVILAISAVVFVALITMNYVFLKGNNIMTTISVLCLVFPYFLYQGVITTRRKKLETSFTNFLLDLGSIMETRVSLMQAMPSVYERDYGALTPHIKRLHIETSWGVPFFDAFVKVGRKCKSTLVKKSISAILGTFVSGGDLKRIFHAIGLHANEMMNIRETVRSRVRVITFTCYLIFSCLVISVMIIRKNFIPSFVSFGAVTKEMLIDFNTLTFHLMLIQSVFTGLITGQMAESSMVAGVKHSLVLCSITILIYGLFP